MSVQAGPEWVGKLCAGGKEFLMMESAVKRVTFSTLTTGAAAEKYLFHVTGTVVAYVFAVCETTSLESAGGGTIELGTVDATTQIAAAQSATTIDAGEIWINGLATKYPAWSSLVPIITRESDIEYKIRTAAITAGVLDFYCYWFPITDNGNVEVAGENDAV